MLIQRCVACCILVVSALHAQALPSWRQFSSLQGYFEFESPTGTGLISFPSASSSTPSTVTWDRLEPVPTDIFSTQASLPVSIDLPGDLADGPAANEVLVVGYDMATGGGRLLWIRLDRSPAPAFQVLGDVSIGIGRDPVGLVWNRGAQRLFVIDRQQRELLTATWAGAGNPLPTVFETALDDTAGPFLDGSDDWKLFVGEQDSTLVRRDLLGHYFEIADSGSGWAATKILYTDVQPLTRAVVEDPSWTDAGWPIRVMGPVGTYDVLDLTAGHSIGSIAIGTADAWADVVLPTSMVPGHDHALERGGQVQARFTPLARFGEASTAGGLEIAPGIIAWGNHRVGNDRFGCSTSIRYPDPPPGFSFTADAYLWLAAAMPGDAPPISIRGAVSLLNAATIQGANTVAISDSEPEVPIAFRFSVPNDANLEGVRLFMQIACTAPGGNAIVTDVFAVDLLGSEGAAASRQASDPAVRLRAARAWIRGLETVSLRAVSRDLRARIRDRR